VMAPLVAPISRDLGLSYTAMRTFGANALT